MSFPELLDIALAGTSNSAPSIAEVVDGDQELKRERRLMRDASLEGLRWLAGRPLEQPEPGAVVEPADLETRAEVSPAAAARLADILDRHAEALREWLRLVCDRHQRVPPVQLPDLLEVGQYRSVSERELLVEVGGARMVWLARHNPSWAFAAYADTENQFAWGSREDRPLALRRIRRRDAAHGLDLLQATWQSERGDARAGLLSALEPGLSTGDEDFLVDALHDTRREIRDVALRLLRKLPGSRWAARWTERAAGVIYYSGGDVLVREVEEVDSAWQADGLDMHPPKGIDFPAWITQQVMALTPPAVWPAEMLDAILRSDWRDPGLSGLVHAAAAYADESWCTTLITAALPGVDARPLFTTLSESQALEVLRRLLQSNVQKHHTVLATCLREAPWKLDPHAVNLVELWLEDDVAPLWLKPALVRVVDTLEYRLAMRRELDV